MAGLLYRQLKMNNQKAGKRAAFAASFFLPLWLLSQQLQGQSLKEFEANYTASTNGISGEAYRKLSLSSEGGYLFSSELSAKIANTSIASLTETSNFTFVANTITPLHYNYKMTGLRDEHRQITFDWSSGVAVNSEAMKSSATTLSANIQDPLSYQLQLSLLLSQATSETVAVDIVDGDKVATQEFRIIGTESIETKIGLIECVLLERTRTQDEVKSTKFWLAPEFDHMLIKLEQITSQGLTIRLEIESASLAGQVINP